MANSSEKLIKLETYSLLLWLDRQYKQYTRVREYGKKEMLVHLTFTTSCISSHCIRGMQMR